MGDLLFPAARRVSTRRSLIRSGGPNAARLSSNGSRHSSSEVPRRWGGRGTERTTLRWAHATHVQHTPAHTSRRFSLARRSAQLERGYACASRQPVCVHTALLGLVRDSCCSFLSAAGRVRRAEQAAAAATLERRLCAVTFASACRWSQRMAP